MSTVITLEQAFHGFLLYKRAEGVSRHTLRNYKNTFNKVRLYLDTDEVCFQACTVQTWVEFLAWLRDDYTTDPDGVAPRGEMALSPKTITNMHTNLSALYTWAYNTELVDKHLLRMIPRPEYERPEIEAFTQEEVKRLLAACGYARTWKTRDTRSRRPTAERDRLIIRVLLSTGVRASELCEIRLQDVDMSRNAIHVQGKGRGRGSKPRIVYFGKRTAKALWAYLTPRLEGMRPADRLFTVGTDDDPRPLRRRVLWRHLKRIGERAGVDDVSPHRFRHTFAIEFLRNSEDPRALYVLQDLLGHSSLQTVRIYATIAERDHADVAEIADPVDNWRL